MRVKLAACLGMLGTLAGMNCLGQGEKAGKAAPVGNGPHGEGLYGTIQDDAARCGR